LHRGESEDQFREEQLSTKRRTKKGKKKKVKRQVQDDERLMEVAETI